MKKFMAVAVVVVLVAALASFAFADTMKGTVKSVDEKAGSVVLTVDGKDTNLKADKSVDLGKLKAGDKVEATVEKDTLKSVKAEAKKPKAAIGC